MFFLSPLPPTLPSIPSIHPPLFPSYLPPSSHSQSLPHSYPVPSSAQSPSPPSPLRSTPAPLRLLLLPSTPCPPHPIHLQLPSPGRRVQVFWALQLVTVLFPGAVFHLYAACKTIDQEEILQRPVYTVFYIISVLLRIILEVIAFWLQSHLFGFQVQLALSLLWLLLKTTTPKTF